jgi:hypothetical protein
MHLRFVAGIVALLCCVAQPCLADVLITMRVQSDAIDDLKVAAEEQTTTTWLGENKLREDAGDRCTIIDNDAKKLFVINHSRKSYFAFDLPIDLLAEVPEEMRLQIEEANFRNKIEVDVTPTDESKEINGYSTKKYSIEVGGANVLKMTREQWMTEDVGFDVETYKNMMKTMLTAQPIGSEWMNKFWEIKGFPVLSESSVEVMGQVVHTKEELVSVEEKQPAAGTYAPPAGYTEEAFDFLKMMQRGAGG